MWRFKAPPPFMFYCPLFLNFIPVRKNQLFYMIQSFPLPPYEHCLAFLTSRFLRDRAVSPIPNPQPGGPGLQLPLETGEFGYTPEHWVARAPRERYFPYPLTSEGAPEGLFFF